MPIYEYRCSKCGQEFETLVRNSNEKIKCEKCGSARVEKLFSTFAASVKQGGSSSCPTGTCPLS